MMNIGFELSVYKLALYINAEVKHDTARMLVFEKFVDEDTLLTATYMKKAGCMSIELGNVYDAEYRCIETEIELYDYLCNSDNTTLVDAYWSIFQSDCNDEVETYDE